MMIDKRITFFVLSGVLLVAILISGCIDEKNTTSQTSGSLTTPSQTSKPKFEKLSTFEEELVGTWSRYHRYDDSTEYYIFKSDRTACYFEIIDGSRKKESNYGYWKLDSLSNNRYEVTILTAANGNYIKKDIYDYANDIVFLGGYDTLKMTRSSTSRSC